MKISIASFKPFNRAAVMAAAEHDQFREQRIGVPSRMITLTLGVRPFSWQGRF
jgi:hypothetical protein